MPHQIVQAQIIDGIEFYVSKDGSKCGVSQVGLARLCGVGEAKIRQILASNARPWANTKELKDLPVDNLSIRALTLGGSQHIKVIDLEVVAAVVEYYAFESKAANEIAKYSFRKFARKGIDTWIKEVTQFTETSNTEALLLSMTSTLNLLAFDVSEMKAQLIATEGGRVARVTLPRLKEWMESLDTKEYEQLQLPASKTEPLFTLNEWADKAHNGLILSKSDKHALANMARAAYKTMALEMPQKVIRMGPSGYKNLVQAYPARHFVLLNMCYSKLVAQQSPIEAH